MIRKTKARRRKETKRVQNQQTKKELKRSKKSRNAKLEKAALKQPKSSHQNNQTLKTENEKLIKEYQRQREETKE